MPNQAGRSFIVPIKSKHEYPIAGNFHGAKFSRIKCLSIFANSIFIDMS